MIKLVYSINSKTSEWPPPSIIVVRLISVFYNSECYIPLFSAYYVLILHQLRKLSLRTTEMKTHDLKTASLVAQLVKTLPAMQETWVPWVGKIPWRRKWQPTSVYLPGKAQGQRSLVDYSLQGCKNQTQLSN